MRPVAIVALFIASSVAAQDQTGKILFFREPHAMTGDFKPPVFCDSEELARIENGTFYEIEAPPGLHKCNAESSQRSGIEVNVVAGKTAYVHVKLLQGWARHAELANTTEDEFNKHKSKLKPVKEWNRAAITKAEDGPAEPNPLPSKKQKNKHAGKFGDLAVRVTQIVVTPSSKDRDGVAVFVSAQNTGKGVVCADFGATLNTSFGLQYRDYTYSSGASRIREMLPGETAEGSYKFEIKHGVQPFEVVLKLESARYDGGVRTTTIRCGSDSPFKDVFVPDEIRLDVSDLPIAQSKSE